MGLYRKAFTIAIPMSFETGFQTTLDVPFLGEVEIISVSAQVTKALAGTDAGTVAIKNAAGSTTYDTLSFPASSALAATDSSTFTDRVFVPAKSTLKLTSAKATAGGEVLVFIEYQPCPKRPV